MNIDVKSVSHVGASSVGHPWTATCVPGCVTSFGIVPYS